MGFLADKKILISPACCRTARLRTASRGRASARGATLAFTYVNDDLKDRVVKLGRRFRRVPGAPLRCRRRTNRSTRSSPRSRSNGGTLDGLLHSIAFAPREALAGDFLRRHFRAAPSRRRMTYRATASPRWPKVRGSLLRGHASSLLTLTYLGSTRVLENYNVMGLAKASLEANVRYLASCLGPEQIRVNGISAGPIKTLAAAGIGGFSKILRFVERTAPLRRNVTTDEVGNVACIPALPTWPARSPAEITYVDCGFSTVAAGDDRRVRVK